jgi:hypothetical protein
VRITALERYFRPVWKFQMGLFTLVRPAISGG